MVAEGYLRMGWRGIVLSCCVLLILSPEAWARRGNMDSGGGDPYVMDFQRVALVLSKLLKESPIQGLDSDRLAEDILNTKTRLESTEQVVVGGETRCAKFERAKQTITISRECWKGLTNYFKTTTVCHEFRNLYGTHDYGDASLCSKLSPVLVSKHMDPNFRINPVRISGKAAKELMSFSAPDAPFECTKRPFRIPTTNEGIEITDCELQGQIVKTSPVYWWPKNWVGKTEVEVEGPAADYLIGVGASKTPLLLKLEHIRCSANAWAPQTGVCTFLVE